jgi:hypothetical protein
MAPDTTAWCPGSAGHCILAIHVLRFLILFHGSGAGLKQSGFAFVAVVVVAAIMCGHYINQCFKLVDSYIGQCDQRISAFLFQVL